MFSSEFLGKTYKTKAAYKSAKTKELKKNTEFLEMLTSFARNGQSLYLGTNIFRLIRGVKEDIRKLENESPNEC